MLQFLNYKVMPIVVVVVVYGTEFSVECCVVVLLNSSQPLHVTALTF